MQESQNSPLKGVNLGGWLILEKWMTPSLFEGVDAEDEYHFMQSDGAREKVKHHRNTFITEDDFTWIKKHGVEAVRIPIGYWIFKDDAPYVSAIEYLDWAFDMADKYSLQVVIDIHGLKGSQNGYDHSGRKGVSEWFKNKAHREESVTTIEQLVTRYKNRKNFWGIQIINEPKLGPVRVFTLLNFYKKAYQRIEEIIPDHTRFIVSDGFLPRTISRFMPKKNNLVLDVHLYHMTTPLAKFLSLDWFWKKTRGRAGFIEKLKRKQPVMIGEWSVVLRHTTTQVMNKTEEYAAVRHYAKLQLDAYESATSWFYWSYKTEHPGVWSFRTMVEEGVIQLTTG